MDATTNPADRDPRPPSRWLLLAEVRVVWERLRFLLDRRLPRGLPHGEGRAVMVIPGIGCSDRSTRALRRRLRRLGYHAVGWGQGRNLGMRRAIGEALATRLRELAAAYGPVSLVGWSLGGVFARELARQQPQRVRRVITLGSPISGHPHANSLMPLLRRTQPAMARPVDWAAFAAREQAPPVPCTAIYTRSDGVIAWRGSRELPAAHTENVEVRGSHMGLVCNPQVLAVIAERLAR